MGVLKNNMRLQIYLNDDNKYIKDAISNNVDCSLYIRLLLEEKLDEYLSIINFIKNLNSGEIFAIHTINEKLNLNLDKKRMANYGKIISKLEKELNFNFFKLDNKHRARIYIKN